MYEEGTLLVPWPIEYALLLFQRLARPALAYWSFVEGFTDVMEKRVPSKRPAPAAAEELQEIGKQQKKSAPSTAVSNRSSPPVSHEPCEPARTNATPPLTPPLTPQEEASVASIYSPVNEKNNPSDKNLSPTPAGLLDLANELILRVMFWTVQVTKRDIMSSCTLLT